MQILLVLSSLFFSVFYNNLFWKKVSEVYMFNSENVWYFISLFLFLTSVIYLALLLLSYRYTVKPVLILLFMTTSLTSYFMDSYNVVIDDGMINNMFETQGSEVLDLLNLKLFLNIFCLGIVPSYIVYKYRIKYDSFKKEVVKRFVAFFVVLVLIVGNLFVFSRFYTSFFREHKPLRFYTNPPYYLYSFGKYIALKYFDKKLPFKKIGLDAKLKKHKKPKLLVLVVGESARWDHFSLNGYIKTTNPYLKDEDLVNFEKMYSCGTETATSVPCMFSYLKRKEFSIKKAASYENLLDIAKRAGVNVLWIDNNSDSKGVAVRIKNVKNIRGKCNGECRDEVMLKDLPEYLKNTEEDTIIVLHQMGSHGPAYYKRYPKGFERFKPVCKSNQLQECTKEEIVNAYDNTLLYTDYFLSKTIALLKKEKEKFQTALFYMSDHGESLGEGGVYLHAMPYIIAPEAQKRVGSFIWFGGGFNSIDKKCAKKLSNKELSQDNYFSTVLGLMDISTEVYNKNLDIFSKCKK